MRPSWLELCGRRGDKCRSRTAFCYDGQSLLLLCIRSSIRFMFCFGIVEGWKQRGGGERGRRVVFLTWINTRRRRGFRHRLVQGQWGSLLSPLNRTLILPPECERSCALKVFVDLITISCLYSALRVESCIYTPLTLPSPEAYMLCTLLLSSTRQ
jgi:hypothetical protein